MEIGGKKKLDESSLARERQQCNLMKETGGRGGDGEDKGSVAQFTGLVSFWSWKITQCPSQSWGPVCRSRQKSHCLSVGEAGEVDDEAGHSVQADAQISLFTRTQQADDGVGPLHVTHLIDTSVGECGMG